MQKTIRNLEKAFLGESQARNRYTFYSKIAKKEGYEKISVIFEETATQETEHAKWLFRFINNLKEKYNLVSKFKVNADGPIVLGNTIDNLKSAIEGERYEHTSMYPRFARVAREEGFEDIAKRLESIAVAEKHHKDRYAKLLKELEADTIFKKNKEVAWVCRKCGYRHVGKEPPEKCPSCSHPTGYFEVQCEKY